MYDSPSLADKILEAIGLFCIGAFSLCLIGMMVVLGATYISMFVL